MSSFKIKEVGFGEYYYGTTNLINLIPESIPNRFLNNIEPWKTIATQWFTQGIRKESILVPIYGIEKEKAMKHIQCLLNTWSLSKEEKIKNAAYLLSQWFTNITL